METVSERRFYVYAYLRTDGTPYYIGKGTGNRIHERHGIGLPPKDRRVILIDGLTEENALAREVTLILFWGRKDLGTGILRNLTDGGDGISGYVHTEDAKERIRKSNKKDFYPHLTGRPVSIETREKIASAQRGKIVAPETKEKIKTARAKQIITEEHKQAISAALAGKPKTEDHKAALRGATDPERLRRAALIGWQNSPDRGQAISASKLKPQRWSHPEHGEVVCPAKELTATYGVANLEKLKKGTIRHSKGWTWLGAA